MKQLSGEGVALLTAEDSHLAHLMDNYGIPPFWQRKPGFGALVLLILEQQVSLESGAAMYRRMMDLLNEMTPSRVLRAGAASLRGIGVTRQKATYLVEFSGLIETGEFDLEQLSSLSRDEARTRLIEIKGIGPWTADAYLLSALRYPDEFPVGDRALQVGAQEALGLGAAPDEGELEILSQPWRPIRAVAARLIWHAYLERRGRTEILPADFA